METVSDSSDAATTLDEVRASAAVKMVPSAWRYFELSAGGGRMLRDSERAFRRWCLVPRVLVGVSERRLNTSLLGQPVSMPVCIAPTALHNLAHPDGELATARAAASAGSLMVLSSFSTASMADVRRVAPNCPIWLQVYLYKNREITRTQVERAEQLGFGAVVLTADSPVIGMAETEGDDWEAKGIRCPNFDGWSLEEARPVNWDAGATWQDLEWLRSITALPIVVKGVLRGDDALLAAKHGAAAVLVSNHGGRQLDGAAAPMDVLDSVSRALHGSDVEVYVDGGVREASDVCKALALGARAVFIGRPVIWGLAHGGEHGVANVLDSFKRDLDRTLALLGCSSLGEIGPSFVRRKDCST